MQQYSVNVSFSPFARFASHKEGVLGAERAALPSADLRGLFSMALSFKIPHSSRAAQSRGTQSGSGECQYTPEPPRVAATRPIGLMETVSILLQYQRQSGYDIPCSRNS